jgi:hypothetical protein
MTSDRPTFTGDMAVAKRFAVLPEDERVALAGSPELAALIPGCPPQPSSSLAPDHPLILVTPAMAEAWLQHGKQDLVDGPKVRRFIEAMRSGQWSASDLADPIHIDNGQACDGHHRLHAILYSGIAQPMHVKETP